MTTDWDAALRDLTEPQSNAVALILTPIREIEVVANLLAVQEQDVWVVPTFAGVTVYMQVETAAEDDINALLGESRPMPGAAEDLAMQMSFMAPVVLVVSWLGKEHSAEPGVSGQITARRYVGGKFDKDMPAGLIISTADDTVEKLLLGDVTPGERDGVDVSKIDRAGALKYLQDAMSGMVPGDNEDEI